MITFYDKGLYVFIYLTAECKSESEKTQCIVYIAHFKFKLQTPTESMTLPSFLYIDLTKFLILFLLRIRKYW